MGARITDSGKISMSLEHSPELGAYSVIGFCTAHGISRGMFYKLTGNGLGPVTFKVGTRTLVSVESAADWRRRMEQISSAPVAEPEPDSPPKPDAEQPATA